MWKSIGWRDVVLNGALLDFSREQHEQDEEAKKKHIGHGVMKSLWVKNATAQNTSMLVDLWPPSVRLTISEFH